MIRHYLANVNTFLRRTADSRRVVMVVPGGGQEVDSMDQMDSVDRVCARPPAEWVRPKPLPHYTTRNRENHRR